jgi:hypothetical protein
MTEEKAKRYLKYREETEIQVREAGKMIDAEIRNEEKEMEEILNSRKKTSNGREKGWTMPAEADDMELHKERAAALKKRKAELEEEGCELKRISLCLTDLPCEEFSALYRVYLQKESLRSAADGKSINLIVKRLDKALKHLCRIYESRYAETEQTDKEEKDNGISEENHE